MSLLCHSCVGCLHCYVITLAVVMSYWMTLVLLSTRVISWAVPLWLHVENLCVKLNMTCCQTLIIHFTWARIPHCAWLPGDLGSHAQWGILARGVMHSEVSCPGESCKVRYPGPGSHAHMNCEVPWPQGCGELFFFTICSKIWFEIIIHFHDLWFSNICGRVPSCFYVSVHMIWTWRIMIIVETDCKLRLHQNVVRFAGITAQIPPPPRS